MANNIPWEKIILETNALSHDYSMSPFVIEASKIKEVCQEYKTTSEKEVRILCKQDTRESRPQIFKDNNLFILPTKNGVFCLVKGEGYIDIPRIETESKIFNSQLGFSLESSLVGNSEMQHLDYAFAAGLIKEFAGDPSLVLTIRGRKFTPAFDFFVGGQKISTNAVQTEIDGGYEGREKIVLVEAKPSRFNNVIIRQLYYPFRQWQTITKKTVVTVFFEKDNIDDSYHLWEFVFTNPEDYNSIKLVKSERYLIR